MAIAETDQAEMKKLADELMNLRSREAIELALEVAYRRVLGIADTEPARAVPSESEVQG